MAKYRKRPIVVEAVQWFKEGDHPAVQQADPRSSFVCCDHCGHPYTDHGWIRTPQGGHIVCPGDWIIAEMNLDYGHYPCKPDVFQATYEPVDG